ncbi:hypothetical protein [uncultured Jatrophihabitans sp.]
MTRPVARPVVDVLYVAGAATGLVLGGSLHVVLALVLLTVVGARQVTRRA